MSKSRSESNLLKKLESMGALWRVRHGIVGVLFPGHGQRMSTVAVIKFNGKLYLGRAEVSEKDHFNRSLGRTISLGRALKNLKKDLPIEESVVNLLASQVPSLIPKEP